MIELENVWRVTIDPETAEHLLEEASSMVGVDADSKNVVWAAPLDDDVDIVSEIEGQKWMVYTPGVGSFDREGVVTSRAGALQGVLETHRKVNFSEENTVFTTHGPEVLAPHQRVVDLSNDIRHQSGYRPVHPGEMV